jgi:outer membrane protein, heavy metal efflux system
MNTIQKTAAALAFGLSIAFPALARTGQVMRLSLDEAVRSASDLHPGILAGRAAVDDAQSKVYEAKAFTAPELTWQWEEMPANALFEDDGARGIGLRQSIRFPGKRRAGIRAAEQDLARIREEAAGAALLAAAEVKCAYARAVHARAACGLAAEAVSLLDQLCRLSEIRYKAGTGTYLDVLLARMERDRGRNDLVESNRLAGSAMEDLLLLTGPVQADSVSLVDGIDYIPFVKTLEQTLASAAGSHALAAAGHAEERERYGIRSARLLALPDFSVGLARQRAVEQPPFDANGFHGVTVDGLWSAEFSVSVPLWPWVSQRNRFGIASRRVETERRRKAALRMGIENRLRNAFLSAQAAETQAAAFRGGLLDDARDALDAAIDRYGRGTLDAAGALQVFRAALDVRRAALDALLRYRLALIDLESAGERIDYE